MLLLYLYLYLDLDYQYEGYIFDRVVLCNKNNN